MRKKVNVALLGYKADFEDGPPMPGSTRRGAAEL